MNTIKYAIYLFLYFKTWSIKISYYIFTLIWKLIIKKIIIEDIFKCTKISKFLIIKKIIMINYVIDRKLVIQ